MQDPKFVHLQTSDEVKSQGWAAEARDSDGHLVSTMAWVEKHPNMHSNHQESAHELAEWVLSYSRDDNYQITLFPENMTPPPTP